MPITAMHTGRSFALHGCLLGAIIAIYFTKDKKLRQPNDFNTGLFKQTRLFFVVLHNIDGQLLQQF